MGRDIKGCRTISSFSGFNPRARVGRDQEYTTQKPNISMFQSTRPRGARRAKSLSEFLVLRSFNPRARVGRDFALRMIATAFTLVSIHAPAWGATC